MTNSLQQLPPQSECSHRFVEADRAVVEGLYKAFRDLTEDHGDEYGLNHDHLLHILYPSQIVYGPVTEANADWTPGLSIGIGTVSGLPVMEVTRVYR